MFVCGWTKTWLRKNDLLLPRGMREILQAKVKGGRWELVRLLLQALRFCRMLKLVRAVRLISKLNKLKEKVNPPSPSCNPANFICCGHKLNVLS